MTSPQASLGSLITGLVELLNGPSPDAGQLWDGATRRNFNIGIQGGEGPRVFEFALRPMTLEAAARTIATARRP